jgi:hypothetical protein
LPDGALQPLTQLATQSEIQPTFVGRLRLPGLLSVVQATIQRIGWAARLGADDIQRAIGGDA